MAGEDEAVSLAHHKMTIVMTKKAPSPVLDPDLPLAAQRFSPAAHLANVHILPCLRKKKMAVLSLQRRYLLKMPRLIMDNKSLLCYLKLLYYTLAHCCFQVFYMYTYVASATCLYS